MLDCLHLTMDELHHDCLAPDSPFECRFLSDAEVLAAARETDSGWSTARVSAALRNGDRCFGILDAGRLASTGWYARRPATIMDDWTIHFDPSFAYMYGGFTHPDYRGLRLHSLGVARALRELSAEGIAGLLSNCERTNYRSWVSVARMGWSRVGSFYRFDLPGRSMHVRSRVCDAYQMSSQTALQQTGSS